MPGSDGRGVPLGGGVVGRRGWEGEGVPVVGTGGEGEDGEREEEDEVVDDDLDERGSDEEGADSPEEDCATVAGRQGETGGPGCGWGGCGVQCCAFSEEAVAKKTDRQEEQGEVAGVEVVADEQRDEQREWERSAAAGGPAEEKK